MASTRTVLLCCSVLLIGGCSSLPYCYSTSSDQARKSDTSSCPEFMCFPGGGDSVCVTSPTGPPVLKRGKQSRPAKKPSHTPAISRASSPTPAPTPGKLATNYAADRDIGAETDLRRIPPEHYAVQVVAMSSRTAAQAFIEERELAPAVIIAVDTPAGPGYAVIINYVASKTEARALALSYQALHGGKEPWLRRVYELREAVERLN